MKEQTNKHAEFIRENVLKMTVEQFARGVIASKAGGIGLNIDADGHRLLVFAIRDDGSEEVKRLIKTFEERAAK